MSLTEPTQTKPWDKLALAGAAIAAVMAMVYIWLVSSQGGAPAVWVVLMLTLGAACAAYGAQERRGSLTALWTATLTLGLLGLFAILSIGLPILVAAALCCASAIRALPRLLAGR